MTIYEIKRKVKNAPYFFDRKTMIFFNQTLKSFKVRKLENNNFLIYAPIKNNLGKIIGNTERIFNPITNKFN